MANILSVQNGAVGTLVPGTSWAAPNGMFGSTADRNDGSAYGWSDSTATITLPSSGLADGYLFLWGFETEDSSNGRYNPQGRMQQTSGTGTFVTATTGGYSRDASEDRAYVSGWSFVDNPSASSTYQFQWQRDADAPNTTDGTARAFIQAIPFYYSDIGLYTSTSTTATGGTTPTQISGFSGTDGTNITISSSQVSVTGDNKRYLCLGSAYHDSVGGGARTQRWFGFEIDGSFDHSAKGCMYYRDISNDEGGESFIKLIETATATRTIELNQYRGDGVAAGQGGADVDGTTTSSAGAHAMVIIELNDSAEVFSSVDSVGGQEFALTGPVDVDIASTGDIEFSDSASFTRVTDIAVNCESAMDVFAFANVSHAREASSIGSGSRWTVYGEFTINGTEQTDVGFHGNFNRGNQSSQDCHGSSCNQAGVFAVTAGQDIGVSNTELLGSEGGGGDIESQPGWVGFGLINLDTLAAAGGDTNVSAGVDSLTLTEYQALSQLAPRVWLNTTESKTGADEMTVTAWSTDGTSLTFSDPSGGKTGSLKLGVEDTRTGQIGWIDVTVTSSGTEVSANVDALTLAELAASISLDVNVAASVDALSLVEYPAAISFGVNVEAGVDNLTLSEFPAAITLDRNVQANVDNLSLAEAAATVSFDVEILAGVRALSLATFPASLSANTDISTNVHALTLTTYPAALGQDTNVAAGVDALTLTEQAASISLDVNIAAGLDALALVEYSAAVSLGVNIEAGTDALAIATFPAAVTLDVEVLVGVDALTLQEFPASLGGDKNAFAGVAALTLDEKVASITYDVEVLTGVDALVVATFSASVGGDKDVAAGVDALTLSEYPAGISLDRNISANVDALIINPFQAQIGLGSEILAVTDALTLAEYQADIGFGVEVFAGVNSLSLATFSATIQKGAAIVANVHELALTEHSASIVRTDLIYPSKTRHMASIFREFIE